MAVVVAAGVGVALALVGSPFGANNGRASLGASPAEVVAIVADAGAAFVSEGEATLDFGVIGSAAEETLTVTVEGAVTTDAVVCTPIQTDLIPAGVVLRQARVSVLNTVSVTLWNANGSSVDPDPIDFACAVIH